MKKVNFFKVISQDKKSKYTIDIQDPFTKKIATIAVALLVISMLIFAIRVVQHRQLKKDYEAQQEVISSPEFTKVLEEDEALTNQILANQYNMLIIDKLEVFVTTAQEFETSYRSLILSVKPSNVTIETFSYANGVIQINCSTPDDKYPADFTKALEDTEVFESVQYNGFTRDSEGNITFPINCVLKLETVEGEVEQ